MCELCDENAFLELNDALTWSRLQGHSGAVNTASETSSNDDGLHRVPSISREFCVTLCFHQTCSNSFKCQVWLKAVIIADRTNIERSLSLKVI